MAGKIIQYQQTKISTVISGSASFNPATTSATRQGSELMTVSITPTATNSIIVVRFSTPYCGETTNHSNQVGFAIYRNNENTAIQLFHWPPRYYDQTLPSWAGGSNHSFPCDFQVVDQPNTTSPIIYRLYGGCPGGGVQLNGMGGATFSANLGSCHSLLYAMEIEG